MASWQINPIFKCKSGLSNVDWKNMNVSLCDFFLILIVYGSIEVYNV